MNPIFAHHAMLEMLDVFHFHPVTAGQHALVFAAYALILAGVALGVSTGFRVLRARLGESQSAGRRGAGFPKPVEGSL